MTTPTGQFDDPRDCVILVPVATHIQPQCETALHELELRGYAVWRVRGYAAIDQERNQMATDALAAGFTETMWIDSDVSFNPDDVDQLRRHRLPITCGVCVKKGNRELAIHVLEGTECLVFGPMGGLTEVKYAGTGFLHVRAAVYDTIQTKLKLPTCNTAWSHPMVPFFQPMIKEEPWGRWYLAEDYAFCERARRCGFRVVADTSFRLGHIGNYTYTWEDAGSDVKRFTNYTYHLHISQRAQVHAEDGTPNPQSREGYMTSAQALHQAHTDSAMVSKTRWRREQELLAMLLDDRLAFRREYRRSAGISEPHPLPGESDWERILEILDREFPRENCDSPTKSSALVTPSKAPPK